MTAVGHVNDLHRSAVGSNKNFSQMGSDVKETSNLNFYCVGS